MISHNEGNIKAARVSWQWEDYQKPHPSNTVLAGERHHRIGFLEQARPG